jgi:hypothetical protein
MLMTTDCLPNYHTLRRGDRCHYWSRNFALGIVVVWFMVFNATFNNIPDISLQSVLLVEEMDYPEKTTDLSLANFIIYWYIEYTSPECVVIG